MADTSDHGNITTPKAADLNAAARRYAASQGWAMPDGSYPIRPTDNHGADDAAAAVMAVGRGSGEHDAIRKHIITRLKANGQSDKVPETWAADGSLTAPGSRSASRVPGRSAQVFVRTFPWDMEIMTRAKGGDGRTLYGYAVPFNQVQRIDATLTEAFARSAFDHQMAAMHRVGYWHYHSSDPRTAQVGALTVARAEDPGLYEEARISNTSRGNDLLELVHDGAITEQSVGFRCTQAGTEVRDGVEWRVRADLTELAAVPNGAYGPGAPIMGARGMTVDACPHCGHVELHAGPLDTVAARGIALTIDDLEPVEVLRQGGSMTTAVDQLTLADLRSKLLRAQIEDVR